MPEHMIMRPAVTAEQIVPQDQRLGDVLRRQRRARPEAVTFEAPSRCWTNAEADDMVNRVAQGLLALGIGPSHRVACLTRHGVECTLLMLAIQPHRRGVRTTELAPRRARGGPRDGPCRSAFPAGRR
jgi:acyl-CoA synthetase (AMP-forming)/AMP-acid ligase II